MQRLTFPFPFVHHQSHDWLNYSILGREIGLLRNQKPSDLLIIISLFRSGQAFGSGTTINRGNENSISNRFPRLINSLIMITPLMKQTKGVII